MRLYAGTATQFISDTNLNQIAGKLKESFFYYYRCNPSRSEVRAWENSLRAVALLFGECHLSDHGVILEYQLPLSSRRLDCMLTGRDETRRENAIIIELKQWERCKEADGINEVITYLGGGEREVLHPSVQVRSYRDYLADYNTAFYEGDGVITLSACTYLHNYSFEDGDPLLAFKFRETLCSCPLFSKDDVPKLEKFIIPRLSGGGGIEILGKVLDGKHRPSKLLMDHVAGVIEGNHEYDLLDEQLIVFDKVLSIAEHGFHDKKKTVLLVRGGPGTGKSVIAINLMAKLLKSGFNAQYVTGSRAFTETLRTKIGRRGKGQFGYFNSYAHAERDEIDVLICDEAHRLRETSNNRFTRKDLKSGVPQIKELLSAAKVIAFFIDENQVVRPGEIGSCAYIKSTAQESSCNVGEYELEIQFRCGGSDAFVKWIENTLDIDRTPNVLWSQNESFDFRILDSPEALEKAIRQKARAGLKARMTAGFCWKWSKGLDGEGRLQDDVVIGDYHRPWNAQPDIGKLPQGIPKAQLWASDPNGIDQIGCIYTAQGFEFDYAGVIFGTDLRYNFETQRWEGHPEDSHDTIVKKSKGKFMDLVKNTYRVLLSRGISGCYVCFLDRDTERFFRSRMEVSGGTKRSTIIKMAATESAAHSVPLFNMGQIESNLPADFEAIVSYQVASEDYGRDNFLVRLEDERMSPTAPGGSICLFKKFNSEPPSGATVLCTINGYKGSALVGIYSQRNVQEVRDGKLESRPYVELVFSNSYFPPIVVHNPKDINVLALFIKTIGPWLSNPR